MNNKNEKKESNHDLKVKLLRHLEQTGLPIELQVGSILSRDGWRVEYNSYYIDEDEQKGREIDILAHTNSYSKEPNVCVWLKLVCEVKQSQKYPWVVLSTKRGLIEGEGWLRLHHAIGAIDGRLIYGDEIDRGSTTEQFTRIGRSYYEGFKSADTKSVIFEALTTVIKASEYSLRKEMDNKGFGQDDRNITFIDPIIVLNGLLYEAYLNDDNHVELHQIRHIPVSFGYISTGYDRSRYLVEIVTVDEFPNLLLNKQKWIDNIKNNIIHKLRESS